MSFLARVVEEHEVTAGLVQEAYDHASRWRLNAVDALIVAAAVQLRADELVTTERPTSPLLRVTAIPERSIHPAR